MADINKRGPGCEDGEGERGKRGKRGPRGRDGERGERGESGATKRRCTCACAECPDCPKVTLAGCSAVKSPYFINVCCNCKSVEGQPCICQPNTRDDGISIAIQDVGTCINGTIVLVAGALIDTDYFLYQVNNLAGRGYRVITVTLRGNGASDQPYDSYSYDIWADDLRQVLDCLAVDDVTLVGHSTGSGVAIHYAARHECCHIGRLVLTATAPLDTTFAVPAVALDGIIAAQLADYPATAAFLAGLVFFPQVPSSETLQFIIRSELETNLYSNIQQNLFVQRTAPTDNILLNDLPNVCVPTLILHGTQDLLTPFGIALQLNAGIAGSMLVPFVNSGHLLMITESQLYNDQLDLFASTGTCTHCEDPYIACKKLVGWHLTNGPEFEEP